MPYCTGQSSGLGELSPFPSFPDYTINMCDVIFGKDRANFVSMIRGRLIEELTECMLMQKFAI